ncbi:hypothetical protein [Aerosakkonema funiforme]|uniref:hypothetical protein n=1 Tax=Aerosakkonema funiforme TaxID=1246630 RepID=UPI001689D0EF|nr:hypothetical protein [Aerosakkonema funiforme]
MCIWQLQIYAETRKQTWFLSNILRLAIKSLCSNKVSGFSRSRSYDDRNFHS